MIVSINIYLMEKKCIYKQAVKSLSKDLGRMGISAAFF